MNVSAQTIPEADDIAELSAGDSFTLFEQRIDALMRAGLGHDEPQRNSAAGLARNLWPALAAQVDQSETGVALAARQKAGLTREQALQVVRRGD